jgi:hypothetical protein
MEEMHIRCPHCGNEMEVSLHGKKSSLVVCVCGHCKRPLISIDGDVFELDGEEFHTLRKKLTRVVDALRESIETHQDISPLLEKAREAADPSMMEDSRPMVDEVPPKNVSKADKISKEDVDNLRIDLETCKDVSDFIDRL